MTADRRATLLALAAEVERAEGPSRRIDERIATALGTHRYWISKHRHFVFEGPDGGSRDGDSYPAFDPDTGKKIDLEKIVPTGWADEMDVPEYTSSLDAAASLVPEGWFFSLHTFPDALMGKNISCHVAVWRNETDRATSDGATSALALVAAALRAQAEGGDGG